MSGTFNLDASFAALSDPTRRAILAQLALGEATVTDLAKPFKMTQPAVSQHLKVLAGWDSGSNENQEMKVEKRTLRWFLPKKSSLEGFSTRYVFCST
jgi:DNA-binding transcriptional ArsR family regulator